MLSDIVCRWESPYKGWGLLASALLLALPSTLQGPTSPPSWSVPFMAVKTFTSPGNIFRCVHISSTCSRQLVGPSIRAYVGHTFRFPLIVSLDRRPRDMIYFLKAMTNSFQTSISKVYFCKVCPSYASSKLCELISYAHCTGEPSLLIQLKLHISPLTCSQWCGALAALKGNFAKGVFLLQLFTQLCLQNQRMYKLQGSGEHSGRKLKEHSYPVNRILPCHALGLWPF